MADGPVGLLDPQRFRLEPEGDEFLAFVYETDAELGAADEELGLQDAELWTAVSQDWGAALSGPLEAAADELGQEISAELEPLDPDVAAAADEVDQLQLGVYAEVPAEAWLPLPEPFTPPPEPPEPEPPSDGEREAP
jgi:hypothetical protein